MKALPQVTVTIGKQTFSIPQDTLKRAQEDFISRHGHAYNPEELAVSWMLAELPFINNGLQLDRQVNRRLECVMSCSCAPPDWEYPE